MIVTTDNHSLVTVNMK